MPLPDRAKDLQAAAKRMRLTPPKGAFAFLGSEASLEESLGAGMWGLRDATAGLLPDAFWARLKAGRLLGQPQRGQDGASQLDQFGNPVFGDPMEGASAEEQAAHDAELARLEGGREHYASANPLAYFGAGVLGGPKGPVVGGSASVGRGLRGEAKAFRPGALEQLRALGAGEKPSIFGGLERAVERDPSGPLAHWAGMTREAQGELAGARRLPPGAPDPMAAEVSRLMQLEQQAPPAIAEAAARRNGAPLDWMAEADAARQEYGVPRPPPRAAPPPTRPGAPPPQTKPPVSHELPATFQDPRGKPNPALVDPRTPQEVAAEEMRGRMKGLGKTLSAEQVAEQEKNQLIASNAKKRRGYAIRKGKGKLSADQPVPEQGPNREGPVNMTPEAVPVTEYGVGGEQIYKGKRPIPLLDPPGEKGPPDGAFRGQIGTRSVSKLDPETREGIIRVINDMEKAAELGTEGNIPPDPTLLGLRDNLIRHRQQPLVALPKRQHDYLETFVNQVDSPGRGGMLPVGHPASEAEVGSRMAELAQLRARMAELEKEGMARTVSPSEQRAGAVARGEIAGTPLPSKNVTSLDARRPRTPPRGASGFTGSGAESPASRQALSDWYFQTVADQTGRPVAEVRNWTDAQWQRHRKWADETSVDRAFNAHPEMETAAPGGHQQVQIPTFDPGPAGAPTNGKLKAAAERRAAGAPKETQAGGETYRSTQKNVWEHPASGTVATKTGDRQWTATKGGVTKSFTALSEVSAWIKGKVK